MSTNRLIHEKSPYLLQHAHNPVDWYPWSEAAFEAARQADKPIFLSIGYATCHWCHVMEKESFEDEEAARLLNETFICIKVDREERPDIDAVYMAACQMITGRGGWPLTIFMTPDKHPFFAATYLPKNTRMGQYGLMETCRSVKTVWNEERSRIVGSTEEITAYLGKAFEFVGAESLDHQTLDIAFKQIDESFDAIFGGFESAPKFPTPHRLIFLLRHYHRTGSQKALEIVEKTITAMRMGGIWDHVGLGFHRYSTDRMWLLPHFEKMLYDQALMATACVETWQITKKPLYAEIAEDIFTYVLRDMTTEEGGFCAAEDADSEGEEGKFYVWTLDEFREVLGDETAERWSKVFGMMEAGNFADESTGHKSGANILHLKHPLSYWAEKFGTDTAALEAEWSTVRRRLFDHRVKRIAPLKDDKVLTDWNGLMIAAMAAAGRVLGRSDYTDAAEKATRFIVDRLWTRDDQLLHRYRDGEAAITGKADDYAFVIWGLLELYQSTFSPEWLQRAIRLQERMDADFLDEKHYGYFLTAASDDDLPVRPKELYDGAIPSANSVALMNLLRLGRLTGDTSYEELADKTLRAFAGSVIGRPSAFTFFLIGVDYALNRDRQIVIVGEPEDDATKEMLSVLRGEFAPYQSVLLKTGRTADPLARMAGFTGNLTAKDGQATGYICKDFSCRQPTTDVNDFVRLLKGGGPR